MTQRRHILCISVAGFLFALDQVAKFFAVRNQSADWLPLPWVGWDFYANAGIAFSLPFPNALLVFATPLLLLALFIGASKATNAATQIALILIFFGALSNWIDRLLYEYTVDYLRFFSAVINIADILIVSGAMLLLFHRQEGNPSDTIRVA